MNSINSYFYDNDRSAKIYKDFMNFAKINAIVFAHRFLSLPFGGGSASVGEHFGTIFGSLV